MGRVTERGEIRELLCRDRVWSVYALGDLDPQRYGFCTWYAPGPSLLYREFEMPILFAGDPAGLDEILADEPGPLILQVKPAVMEALEARVEVTKRTAMWRMAWDPRPLEPATAARLRTHDVPALERLFADGSAREESPDFFYPAMVEEGVFYGIFEGRELVGAAGTHIVSRAEGTAAIGNVYVRADRRGRGLGREATSAVVQGLAGIETIGLNVRQDNAVAIRTYESLGFRRHCAFYEGFSVPRR